MLLDRLERELTGEFAARIQRHDDRLAPTAEQKAREILATAIQRYAAEHTADTTVSTVDIPSDDMKGRIIGREGRNIRTFEKLTGVDVIVDDTPGVVIVSAFDNVRRETARLALTKLIQDGRIHPTRIEEVVTETQEEMETHILEVGKAAATEADVGPRPREDPATARPAEVPHELQPERTATHSLEVAHLCGMMADETRAERAAGPAVRPACTTSARRPTTRWRAATRRSAPNWPSATARRARKCCTPSPATTTTSRSTTSTRCWWRRPTPSARRRPGARRETLEKYVKRMEELEAVACGFPGVDHAFAIQAGRELRVIANAHQTTDADAIKVCRDIARAIEQQLDYPGEIKVTVVRETRAVEFAK